MLKLYHMESVVLSLGFVSIFFASHQNILLGCCCLGLVDGSDCSIDGSSMFFLFVGDLLPSVLRHKCFTFFRFSCLGSGIRFGCNRVDFLLDFYSMGFLRCIIGPLLFMDLSLMRYVYFLENINIYIYFQTK